MDSDSHSVTAVIVAHDGARWLPETLDAVRGQSRPVERVAGADTGSSDHSGRILADHIAADARTALPANTGFGEAVRAALDVPRLREAAPPSGTTEWVWLLHDDCAPDPDALHHLLAAADDDPRAAVLGPKLRDWFDRRLLVEVGVTIDGAGRRETGLEAREFDHGQHDGLGQVLAVSSAGMLVRRDVWDELEGFDPRLPLFRDDIDFCWRAGAAGYRTRIVPEAVAYHAEATARRRRDLGAANGHPRRLDRRNALFVLLANLPPGAMAGAFVRNAFTSLLRVLIYTVGKQPGNALDEAAAIASSYARPGRLISARLRRRRTRRRTYSAIRPFLARGVAVRQFVDLIYNVLSGSRAVDTPGRHQAVTLPPESEDDDPLHYEQGPLRRLLSRPGVLLVAGLTLVTLVAQRSLLLGDHLAGGALPPVQGDAFDLWATYLAGWHDVGVGSGAAAPPYVGLLALLSTLALGKTWLAVTVILVGSVPLAGLTAYLLARRILSFRPAQLWMAGSYALLPMATGAVAQGRLGTALVHALLPVLGILANQLLTLPPRQSRRAAWALALLLAVATAFVPLVWLFALVAGLLVVTAFGHLGRRLHVSVGIALGTAPVLLLPWSLELFTHPSMWLLEAGLHRPELSDPPASPEALLLLSPGGPGSPPLWVTAGFLGAALCALVLLRRRMLVATGWAMALFGLLVAVAMTRLPVAPPYGGPAAPPWPGVALAFSAAALLLAAAIAAHSFGVLWQRGGIRRVFAAVAALLALSTPVSAAVVWTVEGAQTLDGDAPAAIPGFLPSLSDDGTQPRTLVLSPSPDDTVRYSVLRGREPRLGEEQIPADEEAGKALDTAVSELSAGVGGDGAERLTDVGIGFVLLPRPDIGTDADVTMVDTMDGVPGLSRMMLTDEFGLWRTDDPAGRLRVTGDGDPRVLETGPGEGTAKVPDGSGDRTLILAEPAADGWTATLDGRELEPGATSSGMRTFDLPASGGRLELSHDDTERSLWLLVQGALFATVAVLALPGMRTEEEIRQQEEQERETPRPRRPRRARRAASGGRTAERGRRGRGARRKGDRQ
ncbi:GT2 family glycosyltransferase [Haloactinospora alba]|uniref:GT2 family glycosyltransferase n=1 Tax=Haloactinospora alba TaxID=405555 RepID=A0A543NF21_9ACTN|nr:glycosyltransferase family 2 protein [Haloactinospora alba]TQN30427.1 GT2 family glycosyltransferase [Haloactinospora alba]